MTRILFLAFVSIILSGCTGNRAVLWHGPNSSPASIAAGNAAIVKPAQPAAVVPVFVATSREHSNDFSLPFNSKRSDHLNFARVDVGIPKAHVKGVVEKTGYKPDPAKHFAAVSMQNFDNGNVFVNQLNQALDQRGPKDQELLIFVHGYNNNFADSTFRAAQFTHDYGLKSVTVHYAWPSAASLGLYVYDRDSANFARDGLAELLKLAAKTKAKRILLVGHSMGSFVTMEALRTLSLNEEQRTLNRLTNVLLAAPDIDLNVFENQVKDVKPLPPMGVMVSRNDSALNISGRITGGHARVGDGTGIATLQKYGIAVLDASKVDGGDHSVFASSPTLMTLVSDGSLSFDTLKGEGQTSGQAMLADGTNVVADAASMVIYLPGRILTAAASGFQQ
ncbi:alpha/beta hydrolase [Pseudochrobactrum asaccharolyticum]|jgi:esterase/lipase superfamily enzyme|uniref:Esterase/lipase superfamily enzyme n=1 Tax=Pseudochrobactrum asaccharolyticum TaxID=354351 RepID=A0A366DZX1_9HYPH|nr:alpha/beta fold hydrolase [Pseudochrobactrum asaccharolyticum]MDR2312521.1 alpha/beta fold hydrolase [Brucellaceae bacterium]RBO94814.1 esterase/lipase superfamily enzyme [Pseudochrobactrum asaccharolyticum]